MQKSAALSLFPLVILAGCGGGGGGTAAPPPPPQPSVQLAVTSGAVAADLAPGDELPVTVSGTWVGTRVEAPALFLAVRDAAGRFAATDAVAVDASGKFALTLPTQPTLKAGSYTGTLEVRACQDAKCATVYPSGTTAVNYALTVTQPADWLTHQHDAGHSGYVPLYLNPARFAQAWTWNRASGSEPIGGINEVAVSNGRVYVTNDVYFGPGTLYALDAATGTESWRATLASQAPSLSGPAVGHGLVVATVGGHENSAVWAFDAATGTFHHKSAFSSQWPNYLPPVVDGDAIFAASGYYTGEVDAYSVTDGARLWSYAANQGPSDMFAPAVDSKYVYHDAASALHVFDRATGAKVAVIDDPFGSGSGYSYHGTPLVGGHDNVIAFAGGTFSGRAASSAEQFEQRVLSSFDIANRKFGWATQNAYLTAPALAKGVLYAARNEPMSFDAIDEATGKVLWSWAPSGGKDQGFHRNVVVTRNLAFVSTDVAVYAIDLATHKPVWSYPKPGMLALSADGMLFVATGARLSDGGLVAIKLR